MASISTPCAAPSASTTPIFIASTSSSGAAENLTAHSGKQLIAMSDVMPDGKTLAISSNERGGYNNVALLDVASGKKTWVTDTQWEASSDTAAPHGDQFTYDLNADGRRSIYFADAHTLHATKANFPDGLNSSWAIPAPIRPTARS